MHRLKLILSASIALALVGVATGATGAATPAVQPWKIGVSTNRESRDAEIYSMRANGSGVRRLTRSPFFDGFPVWSPTVNRIAFYSQRSPKGDVYVMRLDGSGVRNLTRNRAHDGLGSWSPDGRRIVFDSDRDGGGIYVMNADGSAQHLLYATESTLDGNPQWSPDGRTILFRTDRDGNAEIYAMNGDGTDLRNLTRHPLRDGDAGHLWSPDGSRIAFTTNRDGNSEVYVMNADGNDPRRLTRSAEDDLLLSWSPDSRHIAFQRAPSSPRWAFFVMNADGTGIRKVAWALPRR
jgi:Tol biopolymer transport system component